MIVTSSTARFLGFSAGPSLKHFILKQQVLNLYRSAIRATGSLPRHARSETIAWVRHEFERNRHLEDTEKIKDKLAACERELRQVLPALRR
ncbi:hypothetical protein BDM02DRAFT_3092573 [Thelephora ganbajun]|uniref:Uncharacterized protein n=1 Tax=Thelephora ganbajun TaxID=370292 RepID=A0ACB6ZMV4_THEGA|nr:hypothetical protein BDM02DRAFT_3092573 [Thelephora ganbajun]